MTFKCLRRQIGGRPGSPNVIDLLVAEGRTSSR
jgi:hypothetical protein